MSLTHFLLFVDTTGLLLEPWLTLVVTRARVCLGKHLGAIGAVVTGFLVDLVVAFFAHNNQVRRLVLVALLAQPLALDHAANVMHRKPTVFAFTTVAVLLTLELVTAEHREHQARAQPATSVVLEHRALLMRLVPELVKREALLLAQKLSLWLVLALLRAHELGEKLAHLLP